MVKAKESIVFLKKIKKNHTQPIENLQSVLRNEPFRQVK